MVGVTTQPCTIIFETGCYNCGRSSNSGSSQFLFSNLEPEECIAV